MTIPPAFWDGVPARPRAVVPRGRAYRPRPSAAPRVAHAAVLRGRRRSSRRRAPPGRVRARTRHDLALVDDEDPVGEREDLVELERDEQDRAALVALLDEPPVHELDGAHVEPAGRLGGDQHARVSETSRATTTFCWLPPESALASVAPRRPGRRTP